MGLKVFGEVAELWNVCPEITRAELAQRAGFTERRNPKGQVFQAELVWGSHDEVLSLKPGQRATVQSSEGRTLSKQYAHKGVVLVDPQAKTVLEMQKRGLENALAHLNDRGEKQLGILQTQYDESTLRRMRNEFRGIFLCIEKEKVLQETLDRLLGKDEEYDDEEDEV